MPTAWPPPGPDAAHTCPSVWANRHHANRISASTRRIRPARLHQQRESGRSDPVSQVVRAPRPIRAIARYWLGCTGWRDDQRRGLAIARSADPRTYAGAVMYVYGGAIPGGVLGPDDSAIREIEDALHGAEQFGDEFALTLARLGLGDALMHRPTEADAGTASWPRSAKCSCAGNTPSANYQSSMCTWRARGLGVAIAITPYRSCAPPSTSWSTGDSCCRGRSCDGCSSPKFPLVC